MTEAEEDDWVWAQMNDYNFVQSQVMKRKTKMKSVSEKEQMQFAKILRKLREDLPLTEDELKILDRFDIDYKKI